MSATIISADFGSYHEPWVLPPQRTPRWTPARAVLVTDYVANIEGWHNVVVDLGSSRMASKIVKCCPEKFTVAEIVIWIDAQIQVVNPDFVSWCVRQLGDADVAVAKHPRRRSILAEAIAGQGPEGRKRFAGQPTIEQVRHYLQAGHPEHWGLYATGVLVRRMTESVRELGRMWLKEQEIWSTHDQLSFPYLCRHVLGQHPRVIPFPHDPMYRLHPRPWPTN